MKPRDAEKLLGGFAAGILTEEEKTQLYVAALAHQEVFDALADEESLRALLADPMVRRRLLDLLTAPEPQPLRPLWRRPAILGVAASLFLLVTTSLVLVRREAPSLATHATAPPKVGISEPTAAVPKAEPAAKPLVKKSEAQPLRVPTIPLREEEPRAASGYLPLQLPAPAAPESKLAKQAPAKDPAAAVEVVASQATLDHAKVETASNVAQERLEQLPALSRTVEGSVSLAPGVAAAKAPAAPRADKGKATSPPVTWTLQDRDSGAPLLVVTHPFGRHLYLLRRTASGVRLLSPQITRPMAGNLLQSTFRFDAGTSDHVDLYLLDHPEPEPGALPEQGALEGYRARVF